MVGDPDNRVPTGARHGNKEDHASDNFRHGANAGFIAFNTHAFGPRAVDSMVISFEACIIGGVQV